MSTTAASSTLNIGEIVGIGIGGIFALTAVIGIALTIYSMCSKKNKQAQVWAEPNPYYPPYGSYGQPTNTGYHSQQSSYPPPPSNKPPNSIDQPPSYSSVYPRANQNQNPRY